MLDNTQNAQARKKSRIFLAAVIILLIAIIVILGVIVLRSFKPGEPETQVRTNGMAYEANVVTDNADALQDAVNQLIEKAREGQMSIEMQTVASSEDGRQFTCHLANSVQNNYDMFMVFYLDDTQQEIHRTGLIPIGARIEEFTLEEALESGTYEATIVYNQVEEDLETIHAQVNVGLTLIVK